MDRDRTATTGPTQAPPDRWDRSTQGSVLERNRIGPTRFLPSLLLYLFFAGTAITATTKSSAVSNLVRLTTQNSTISSDITSFNIPKPVSVQGGIGADVLLRCNSSSSRNETEWKKKDKRIVSGERWVIYENNTLRIRNLGGSDGGHYSCWATQTSPNSAPQMRGMGFLKVSWDNMHQPRSDPTTTAEVAYEENAGRSQTDIQGQQSDLPTELLSTRECRCENAQTGRRWCSVVGNCELCATVQRVYKKA